MKKTVLVICFFLLSVITFAQTNAAFTDVGQLKNLTSVYPQTFYGTATLDNYLYVVGDNNLYVYDISDETAIVHKKTIGVYGAVRVWSGENFVFVYNGTEVQIFDATDKANPQLKGAYYAAVDLHHVRAKGNYMYVLYMYDYQTNKNGSIEVVDISTPTSPVLKDSYKPGDNEGRSFCFSPDGNKIFMAQYNFGTSNTVVREMDITDPTNIQVLRTFTCSGAPVKIEFCGNDLILLKDNNRAAPSVLEVYEIPASGDWTKLTTIQAAVSPAWDMHIYGASITLALMDGGMKDYSWNTQTNTFITGASLAISKASQMSWYVKPQSITGGNSLLKRETTGNIETSELDIVYAVLQNLGTDTEQQGSQIKFVKKKLNDMVTLTMGIIPPDASGKGCSVNPPVGTNNYPRFSQVDVSAIDNPAEGLVFGKWTGSIAAITKQCGIFMDDDESAFANFDEIKLVGSGENKKVYCPCETADMGFIESVTITCTAYGDDWLLTALKLDASGQGDDVYQVKKVKITSIWMGAFQSDNGSVIADFENIVIPQGQSISLMISYYLDFLEADYRGNPVDFKLTATPLGNPINYPNGIIVGSAKGEIWVGQVYNSAEIAFNKINDAIYSNATDYGSVVYICPGTFQENVYVFKSLTLKAHDMNRPPVIKAVNNANFSVEITGENVTLDGLNIQDGKNALYSVKSNSNITINNCTISKAEWGNTHLDNCRKIEIRNSVFNNSGSCALRIFNSDKISVIGSTFRNNMNDLYITDSNKDIVIRDNNFIQSSRLGLILENVSEAHVFYNNFDLSKGTGIQIDGGKNNIIDQNKVFIRVVENRETGSGILVENTYGTKIINNTVYYFDNGIYVADSKETHISNNNVYQNAIGMHLSDSKHFVITENEINKNSFYGIALEDVENLSIFNNKITWHEKNQSGKFIDDGTGIYQMSLSNVENCRIYGNTFFKNCTAIKILSEKGVVIEGNNISNSWCLFTGIHLTGGSPVIRNNNFSNNNGAALMTENNANPTIEFNNFTDNDYALYNSNTNLTLTANNNYFGASGPEADDLFGNIDVPNWLTEPVSLVGTFSDDTLNAITGGLDSLVFAVQNVLTGADSVSVLFSDDNGWLVDNGPFTVAFDDSAGVPVKVYLNVPQNTGAPIYNNITATVNSFNNPGKSATDQVVVMNYAPELNHITAYPDSITITVNDSLFVNYFSYDQYENYIDISPVYSCSNGVISQNGLYKPDGYTGPVTISVTENISGISTDVHIYVANEAPRLNSVKISPANAEVKKNSSIRMTAQGYDQYNYKISFDAQWSCSADTITADGIFYSGDELKNVTITVSDTNNTVTAQTVIHIVNEITAVEETKQIPVSYKLEQNYPNPFNPSTTIQYSLPVTSLVTIEVFNILGQRVTQLLNGVKNSGIHEVKWNTSGLASGVYFYTIYAKPETGGREFREVKKMLYMK